MGWVDPNTHATKADTDVLGGVWRLWSFATWTHATDLLVLACSDGRSRDGVLRAAPVEITAPVALDYGLGPRAQHVFVLRQGLVALVKKPCVTARVASRSCTLLDGPLRASAEVLDATVVWPLRYKLDCEAGGGGCWLTLADPVEFYFVADAVCAELGPVPGASVLRRWALHYG